MVSVAICVLWREHVAHSPKAVVGCDDVLLVNPNRALVGLVLLGKVESLSIVGCHSQPYWYTEQP